jgi:hypothetical protein
VADCLEFEKSLRRAFLAEQQFSEEAKASSPRSLPLSFSASEALFFGHLQLLRGGVTRATAEAGASSLQVPWLE